MEVVLFSVALNKLYDHLKSPLIEEYKLTKNARKELDKLTSTVSTIVSVQKDAAERQVSDHALVDWLKKLRDATYDADDVLDAFATETLRRRGRKAKGKARDLFSWSANPVLFYRRLGRRIKGVVEKLDAIAEERAKFHLKESDGRGGRVPIGYRDGTVSFVVESEIVGRDGDRDAVIARLKQSGSGGVGKPEVISIVGTAGIGKTTLAQLVYNNEWVARNFELRIWICVSSEDFDVVRLSRAIIEQITQGKCELADMDLLQKRIGSELAVRKFLLVLDDVWNESERKWEILEELVSCGAPGSKILVTTRNEKVSLVMGSIDPYHLECLLEEDCWSLFKQRAFKGESEEDPRLVAIGKKIVKNCRGLPLATKVIGSLMYCMKTEEEWRWVEKSEIWDLSGNEIMPALKLSYNHLPLQSRFCFAYCSIFPKDHEMDRRELIQQWIANGLVLTTRRKELEDTGKEIFNDLLSRSFFQDPKTDDYGNITKCKMHDLIHDLAISVAGDECRILYNSRNESLPKKIRYLSIDMYLQSGNPKALYKAKTLRTLLSLSAFVINKRVLADVLTNLRFLRVLDLRSAHIEGIPTSIKNLKQLRYADLSNTNVKALPESTSSLLNLQTLRLNNCCRLQVLPKRIRNMTNLRHLEIEKCSLNHMPSGLRRLSCLQTLTDFIVSKDGAALSELQRLNLGGKLSVRNLENNRNEDDAARANLSGKENLLSLNLSWTNLCSSDMQVSVFKVLSALRPHTNLKQLKLLNYGGIQLPSWISASSRGLIKVILSHCSSCENLPALGQLRFLTELQLIGLQSIRSIDTTFYGSGNGFPSLKELTLSEMPNFKEWLGVEGTLHFDSLHKLSIRDCPKLENMPWIPSLQHAEMWKCNGVLLRSIANLASLSTLIIGQIQNLPSLGIEFFGRLTSLRNLHIADCKELVSFSDNALQHLTSLQLFEIKDCIELISLPNSICHLNSLHSLEISYCSKLVVFPEGLQYLTSLKSLKILGCLSISNWADVVVRSICSISEFQIEVCNLKSGLPIWLQYSESIKSLKIRGTHGFNRLPYKGDNILGVCCCGDVVSLPEELQKAVVLQDLSIFNCSGLTSLPSRLGDQLHSLFIGYCPSLTTLPGNLRVQFLWIKECPDLEERCKEHGEDWHLISHIPRIMLSQSNSNLERPGSVGTSLARRWLMCL